MYYCTSPHSNPQTDIFNPPDADEQRDDPTVSDPKVAPREGQWANASDELEVR